MALEIKFIHLTCCRASRAPVFCTLKSRIAIFVLFLLCASFMHTHTLLYCQIANSGMYSQTVHIQGLTEAQNPLRSADQVVLLSAHHIAGRTSPASLWFSKVPRTKHTTYHICPYSMCVSRALCLHIQKRLVANRVPIHFGAIRYAEGNKQCDCFTISDNVQIPNL